MKKVLLIIFLFLLVGCSSNKNNDSIISYIEAKEKIINENAVLIDVRTEAEYNNRHIDGAILLSIDDIDEDTVSNVIDSKNSVIIVYCQSGNRSSQAVSLLNDLGYNNVYDLGSIDNWEE